MAKNRVPISVRDDMIEWIGEGWRFYFANDDMGAGPYWGFVHRLGGWDMFGGYLSEDELARLIDLLEGLDG